MTAQINLASAGGNDQCRHTYQAPRSVCFHLNAPAAETIHSNCMGPDQESTFLMDFFLYSFK